jgi:hypothetical protein
MRLQSQTNSGAFVAFNVKKQKVKNKGRGFKEKNGKVY